LALVTLAFVNALWRIAYSATLRFFNGSYITVLALVYLERFITISGLVETYDLAILGQIFVQYPLWPLRP